MINANWFNNCGSNNIFLNYSDMENTSDNKNADVNKFNREVEKLHKEWKQFSKQDIIDAMHKRT